MLEDDSGVTCHMMAMLNAQFKPFWLTAAADTAEAFWLTAEDLLKNDCVFTKRYVQN
jgi:hypothetical protein